MRFMVTGASGFVGNAVARRLLEDRHQVTLLIREGSPISFGVGNSIQGDVRIIRGNLSNTEVLRRSCEGCEGVFHVAAQYTYWTPDPSEIYRTNVDGADNLMKAAIAAGVKRFVFTSTVGTLKPVASGGLTTEEDTAQVGELASHYKKSKLMAEQAILAANGSIEAVSVNPTAPFGPGDVRPTPTGRIVLQFLRNLFPGYIETGVNVCDVDDVAGGHLAAYFKGSPGERYILGGENMSLRAIYQTLSQITGLKRYFVRFPWAIAYVFALLDESIRGRLGFEPFITTEALEVAKAPIYVDCSKAIRELGYVPSSAKKALTRSVAWFVNRGNLPLGNAVGDSLLLQE